MNLQKICCFILAIMTFCLMVYNFAQYKIRKALEEYKDMIPNQVKKLTATPTLRWIFRLIYKISVVTISNTAGTQIKSVVSNLCDTSRRIVRYFGQEAMDIYEIS